MTKQFATDQRLSGVINVYVTQGTQFSTGKGKLIITVHGCMRKTILAQISIKVHFCMSRGMHYCLSSGGQNNLLLPVAAYLLGPETPLHDLESIPYTLSQMLSCSQNSFRGAVSTAAQYKPDVDTAPPTVWQQAHMSFSPNLCSWGLMKVVTAAIEAHKLMTLGQQGYYYIQIHSRCCWWKLWLMINDGHISTPEIRADIQKAQAAVTNTKIHPTKMSPPTQNVKAGALSALAAKGSYGTWPAPGILWCVLSPATYWWKSSSVISHFEGRCVEMSNPQLLHSRRWSTTSPTRNTMSCL